MSPVITRAGYEMAPLRVERNCAECNKHFVPVTIKEFRKNLCKDCVNKRRFLNADAEQKDGIRS